MKKLLISVAVVLSAITPCFSQALKSGFDNLQKQKYEDAAKVFSKALSKGNETLAAMYGMGSIICSPDYSGYNAVRGFRMIRNANDRFLSSSAKTKSVCKSVYGFEKEEIYAKMLQVAQIELEKIRKKNTIDDYEWYIITFEGADEAVEEARKLESELVWVETEKNGTFRAYKEFYDKFPTSAYANEAKEKYELGWKKLCREYYDEGEIIQMKRFATQYPDYPFYTEKDKADYELAQEADNLKLYSKYRDEYEPYYKSFIEKAAPSPLAYVALERIASIYIEWGRYAEAADLFLSYSDKFPDKKDEIQKLATMLKSPGAKFKTKAFPSTINTKYDEYAPVMTPDGSTLYFCGHSRPDNIGSEDIFVAENKGNTWQQAHLFELCNTPWGNEAPLAVSPDGNMLLIYKDASIYYTMRTIRGWSQPKKMTAISVGKAWDGDASFSSDGNAIFFISDRNGGVGRHHPHEECFHGSYHGNSDIYVTTRREDGTWSEPINIGAVVNTPYSERSPWLASDMKTLYFSSEGHCGMGMLDVYKSTRLSDTSWTQWSEPINLGKEINTAGDDYNYIISTDGKSAYFSKMTNNGWDICTVDIPEKMRPEVIGIVSGVVSDDNDRRLAAQIKWEDLATGQVLGNLQCNPDDGSYFITLPAGRNYGYFVEMDGYYPVSGNLNTEKLKTGANIVRNIVMQSEKDILEGKVSIVLENVFFDFNSNELRSESYPELVRLANFIKANRNVRLEISGHTDNKGNANLNLKLSQSRALSVKKYLVSLGCDDASISIMGYGDTKPKGSNDTEEGRALNRRVEFKIIK